MIPTAFQSRFWRWPWRRLFKRGWLISDGRMGGSCMSYSFFTLLHRELTCKHQKKGEKRGWRARRDFIYSFIYIFSPLVYHYMLITMMKGTGESGGHWISQTRLDSCFPWSWRDWPRWAWGGLGVVKVKVSTCFVFTRVIILGLGTGSLGQNTEVIPLRITRAQSHVLLEVRTRVMTSCT